jgi:hypothetical protein
MKMHLFSNGIKAALAVALPAMLLAGPVLAQDLIGSYAAYIGEDDLYNSEGARLTEPWQVLRQDRANFHRFGISQDGDEWDPFFEDANNREAMENMIRRGYIDPDAERMILSGGAMVYVNVYGAGGVGDYVEVEVFR